MLTGTKQVRQRLPCPAAPRLLAMGCPEDTHFFFAICCPQFSIVHLHRQGLLDLRLVAQCTDSFPSVSFPLHSTTLAGSHAPW